MEKPSKLRIKILKFLSQAAAPAVTYKSPPPSPRNPIVSIIPKETRRKPRNGSTTFAAKEPTSPKVSCMGQVKGKKKKKKSKPKPKLVCPPPPQEGTSLPLCIPKQKTFKVSKVIPKVLITQGKTMDDGVVIATSSSSRSSRGPERVPSLGQMKRFESGHGVLSDFDLMEVDDDPDRVEGLKLGVRGEEEEDDDDENKKEVIILWKRRSMSPPMPLQL